MIRREIGQAATATATAVSARTERKPSGGPRRNESLRDEPAAVGKAEDDGRRARGRRARSRFRVCSGGGGGSGSPNEAIRWRVGEKRVSRAFVLAPQRARTAPCSAGEALAGAQQLARDLGGELEAALDRLPAVAEVPREAGEEGDHPDAREDGEVDPRVEPHSGVPALPPHASWLLAKT